MVNIYPSARAKTWQVQPATPPSTHILGTSRRAEMILRLLAMCSCTFWEGRCLGKGCQEGLKRRSIIISSGRRKKLRLTSYAKTSHPSSKNSCSTAEGWASPLILTTSTSLGCSKVAVNVTNMNWRRQTSYGTKTVYSWRGRLSSSQWGG